MTQYVFYYKLNTSDTIIKSFIHSFILSIDCVFWTTKQSLLKPFLFIKFNDGERLGTLFHKSGEDFSENVFLLLIAD